MGSFLERMYLFGLHSLINKVKFGVFMGGRMNLQSLDCVELIHESYLVSVFFFVILFIGHQLTRIRLWSSAIVSRLRSCDFDNHLEMMVVVVGR